MGEAQEDRQENNKSKSIPIEFIDANIWANMNYPQTHATQHIVAGAVIASKVLNGDMTWAEFGKAEPNPDSVKELVEKANRVHKAYNLPVGRISWRSVNSLIRVERSKVLDTVGGLANLLVDERERDMLFSGIPGSRRVRGSLQDIERADRLFTESNYRDRARQAVSLWEAASDTLRGPEALALGAQLRKDLKAFHSNPDFPQWGLEEFRAHFNGILDRIKSLVVKGIEGEEIDGQKVGNSGPIVDVFCYPSDWRISAPTKLFVPNYD